MRTGVIGDIDILGAAIAFSGTEQFMIDGTFTRQTLFFLFGTVSNRTDKFFSGPRRFGTCSCEFHLKISIANGAVMRSHGLGFLLIAGIEGDIGFTLEVFLDEIIEFPFIIPGIAQENTAFLLTVNLAKFPQESFGNSVILEIVRAGDLD